MSVSTDVTRGVLGEPGAPYSLILNRSADFGPFFIVLPAVYGTGREIQFFLGLVQMLWDRTEPDGYVPYIVNNNLPGTPAHRVLIHDNIGDYQVTPLGAHFIARTIGAQNLAPTNREVYGIPDAPSPIDGSAMVEWSLGPPPRPGDQHAALRPLPDQRAARLRRPARSAPHPAVVHRAGDPVLLHGADGGDVRRRALRGDVQLSHPGGVRQPRRLHYQ